MDWDAEIAQLGLSDVEKNGLQVFRNYQRAFDDRVEKKFSEWIDQQPFELKELDKVLLLIVDEEIRFVPMIACSFVDVRLKSMFRKIVPDGIPGGKSRLLGSEGPFSSLHRRLQLAFAFDLIDQDLVKDMDALRGVRNKISHSWDTEEHSEFFANGRLAEITPIEELLAEQGTFNPDYMSKLSPEQIFRLRVIWILANFAYQADFYARARLERLNPHRVLYGANKPELLTKVSGVARDASLMLLLKVVDISKFISRNREP